MESQGLRCQETQVLISIQMPLSKKKLKDVQIQSQDPNVKFRINFVDLREKKGQSQQIHFYSNDKNARTDSKAIPMFHGWTNKRVSDMRFKDTHNKLFAPQVEHKWNPDRAQRLSSQETKGRHFHILSGAKLE